MNEMEHQLSLEHLLQLVEQYLAQIKTYRELTVKQFAAFANVDQKTILLVLSYQRWRTFTDAWLLERVRTAMETLFEHANMKEDVAATRIAKKAGVTPIIILGMAQK